MSNATVKKAAAELKAEQAARRQCEERISTINTGICLFAMCLFFAVCWQAAKKVFAVSLQNTDGKELADGKECLCHQPILCRLLADGKERGGPH